MGSKILVSGMLLSFLVFPSYIYAQVDSTTSGGIIRNAIKNRVDEVKIRREEIRDEMKIKRDEFKTRLLTIRDEVKRKVIERIDIKMDNTNKKVTSRFSTILDKLQSILNRLIGKAQETKLEGKDTADLDSAIGTAQAAIDNAKAAVSSQSANMYVIEIASESALKTDVGTTVSQLRADLKDVHKIVIEAKQAVQQVVMEMAKLKGNGLREENSATSSGS